MRLNLVSVKPGRAQTGKPVSYTLAMKDGSKTGGSWLPAQGDPGLPTVLTFGSWEMVHSGKGGKKGACLSDGLVPFNATATIVHSDEH